jgi:mannosyltransferase OCH1-like enzyme
MSSNIPKIIHQIWIGSKPCPNKLMETWKIKNPDFEYIFWNEREFQRRNIIFQCQKQIDLIKEINGKADVIRWEILYMFGGVFIDADSICIEPIDDYFMSKIAFASYENEEVRKGLIATGTMGFPPNHQLCKDIIEWIKSDESISIINNHKSWLSVGPGVLTRFLNTGKYPDFSIFPSHVFLPVHFEGKSYNGHMKVYAHQYWGSNYQLYDSDYFSKINIFELPECLKNPIKWVSVILLSSDNISLLKLKKCLDSIKFQKGHFGIEIVWKYDKTIEINSLFDSFLKSTRFTKISYSGYSGSFIFLMDINFLMNSQRIQKQMDFLEKNEERMICGCHILDINTNKRISPFDKNTILCFRKKDTLYSYDTKSLFYLDENLTLYLE